MGYRKKKFHIKRGDLVEVIAGNEKRKQGKVVFVDVEKDRAIVEGLNLRTIHIKPSRQNPKGRRETRPGSMHSSNLMVVDPQDNKRTRTGRRLNQKGKLQRYSKKTNQFI
jgi:large subunit ribosomal protein L24